MNDKFIYMYMLYKLGCAGAGVFVFMLIVTVMQVMIHENTEKISNTFYIRISITTLLALLGLIIAIFTPHRDEIKAWAYYTVTKDTPDKEEAEKLIQAAFDYLDGTKK